MRLAVRRHVRGEGLPRKRIREGLAKLQQDVACKLARAPVLTIVVEVFAQLRAAPHVAVRLPTALVDGASAHLLKLAEERGYAGRLLILPDPELGPDDCKIEWADGGVVRERAAIEGRINEAVNRYLGRIERTATENDQ